MSLLSSNTSFLGLDIGSTSIKIVEFKKENKQVKLLTYGFSENLSAVAAGWNNNVEYAAKIINKICEEAGIIGRSAVSALPTFSVFSSVLNLSNISKNDISSAVHWEAKKVIPLPLEEMILDWKPIENEEGQDKNNIRVLLTGAPRTLVKKYIDIFKAAQINLISLETETFSLIRSLVGNDKSTIMLVEMGAETTDVSIVDKGIPMLNRSIDVGGSTITKAISKSLNIGLDRSEQFKYDLGISLLDSGNETVPQVIVDTISPIVNEIKYSVNLYLSKSQRPTEKIILSGGSAMLPSLSNYLAKVLNMKVIIGDPWARVSYPVDLKPLLSEIGPRLSVAIGLAMREIE